jgi:phosphopantothenoylcysteine decarboxylase/phosphopantothenate--cysteine ligase
MVKTMDNVSGKRLVLGVTGSVAAYKSVFLASRLAQAGVFVDVILTEAAERFVGPISFSSVTGRRVYLEGDLWKTSDHVPHIELGETNDLFLIAPATANTIAKLAQGLADNLLSLSALASRTPLYVAPAMDGGMYLNPATQSNLRVLEERGAVILEPEQGHLASGLHGKGRMLEPDVLFGHIRQALGREGRLAGKKVVVTAGGTREALDPVRYLTNRSSGRQGYALAQAALDQGAQVTLISGPAALQAPVGARMVQVVSAAQMADAVLSETEQVDVLIMAAAVADYRPAEVSPQKIKKSTGELSEITLQPTQDILQAVAEKKSSSGVGPDLTVGFAAESEQIIGHAEKKLKGKSLDLLAVNDISRGDAGFEVETNQVTLLWPDGQRREIPLTTKSRLAREIIQEIAELIEAPGSAHQAA